MAHFLQHQRVASSQTHDDDDNDDDEGALDNDATTQCALTIHSEHEFSLSRIERTELSCEEGDLSMRSIRELLYLLAAGG